MSEGSRFTVRCVDWLQEGADHYLSVNLEDINSDSLKQMQRLRVEITDVREHNIRVSKGQVPGDLKLVPLRCSFCLEPLYIRTASNLDQYPVHFALKEGEPPGCPQRTGTSIPLHIIRAMQHQGVQESIEHFRLKHLLSSILHTDPEIDPGSVLVESRLKGDYGLWRKPDVQAFIPSDGTLVAFEIQVSKELAPAIAARQYFYKIHPGLAIIWILPSFNPIQPSQTQRDLQTHGADHLFTLTPDCIKQSQESRRLHLQCWLHMPVRNGANVEYMWQSQIVRLDQIYFKGGRATLMDLDAIERAIRKEIARDHDQARSAAASEASTPGARWRREDTEQFSEEWSSLFSEIAELEIEDVWPYLVAEITSPLQSLKISGLWLKARGIDTAQTPIPLFVLRALKSANDDFPDWKNQSWPWITNEMSKACNSNWIGPYHTLLKASGRLEDIKDEARFGAYHTAKRAAQARKHRLTPDEKAFIKLTCPNLPIPEPQTLDTLPLDGPEAGYPVYVVTTTWGKGSLLAPEFMREAQLITPESAEDLVQKKLAQPPTLLNGGMGSMIPMPLLPLMGHRPIFLVKPANPQQQVAWLDQWKFQLEYLHRKLGEVRGS